MLAFEIAAVMAAAAQRHAAEALDPAMRSSQCRLAAFRKASMAGSADPIARCQRLHRNH